MCEELCVQVKVDSFIMQDLYLFSVYSLTLRLLNSYHNNNNKLSRDAMVSSCITTICMMYASTASVVALESVRTYLLFVPDAACCITTEGIMRGEDIPVPSKHYTVNCAFKSGLAGHVRNHLHCQ